MLKISLQFFGGRGSGGGGRSGGGGASGGKAKSSTSSKTIKTSNVSELTKELRSAAMAGDSITVKQSYPGGSETRTYSFDVHYPNGFNAHSVSAWYASDYSKSGLYMSGNEFASYLSAVIGGRGGTNITYRVTRNRRR